MSTPNGTGNVEHSSARTHPGQPGLFQIRIRGQLDDAWTDWFSGMAIVLEEDGHTLLTGLIEDQAALFGLLKRIRDLGMPLVSIHPADPGTPEGPSTSSGSQK